MKHKVVKTIVVVFMPVGVFVILAGMVAKIFCGYFHTGWTFWVPGDKS